MTPTDIDAVQNQLCTRIEELEAEKLALLEENAALAAHVERLNRALGQAKDRIELLAVVATEHGARVYAAYDVWPEEMDRVIGDTPETSLARLKARWQAEGGEIVANVIGGAHDRKLALMRVADLRRQAEELAND